MCKIVDCHIYILEPCTAQLLIDERCRTLIASIAYSTWNNRPSGEKVLTPRSYSERVRIIYVNQRREPKEQRTHKNILRQCQPTRA